MIQFSNTNLSLDNSLQQQKDTYNTGDSLVVTDPTTNPALRSLTMGEQTGSRILCELWSYVLVLPNFDIIYLEICQFSLNQDHLAIEYQ